MNLSSYILPIFIGLILIIGLIKKVDVFSEFIEGAKENLKVGVEIMPTLMALMTAIGMFKASGGLELITTTVAPIIHKLGFPAECVALALIRPISGSGGLASLNQY